MLIRMPWTKDKPPDTPDEDSDLVAVSVTTQQMLSGEQYEELTGVPIEYDVAATVQITRWARAPKKRQQRLSFAPIAVRGTLGVKGDIRIRETLKVTKEFAPSLAVRVAGNMKLAGSIADR